MGFHSRGPKMNIDLDQAVVEVNESKLLRLTGAAGTTLSCISGSLWITQDSNLKDIVLYSGQSHVVEGPQPVIVSSFKPGMSLVCVLSPLMPSASWGWLQYFRQLLLRWSGGLGSLSRISRYG